MTTKALYNSFAVIVLCSTGVLSDYSCICNYAVEEKVLKTPDTSSEPIGYLYEFDCKHKLDRPGIQPGFAAIAFQHYLGYVSLNEDTQEQICQGSPPAGDVINDSTSMEAVSATITVSTIPSSSYSPISTTLSPQASTTSDQPSHDVLTVTTLTATTLDPSPSSTIKSTSTHNYPSTTFSTSTASSLVITTSSFPSTTNYMTNRITSTHLSPTSSGFITSTPSFTASGIDVHSFTTSTFSTSFAIGLITPSQTTSATSSFSTVPSTSYITTTTADLSSLTTSGIISTNPSTTIVTSPSHSSTSTTTHILSPTPTFTSSPTVTMAPTTSLPTATPTIRTTYTPKFANVDVAGSDLRYIGIGYDLFAGNPGGMDNGSDPGLLLSRRVLQLSTRAGQAGGAAREVDHILLNSTCISKNYFIHDGGGYQKELLQSVYLPNSEVNAGDAFVFNKEFLHVRHEFENNKGALYRDKTLSCSYAKLRYREELANASQFMISREFAGDVCKLPSSYDATSYINFISKWGTDVVMGTTVGTMTLSRYSTSRNQLLQHAQKQAPDLFHPTGIYQGYPTSVTFNSTSIDTARLAIFGSKIASYRLGSQSSTAPLHITLSPIWSALDAKYWSKVLSFKEYMDICPDSTDQRFLNQIAHNIELAVRQYPAYKRTTAETQVPVSLKNEPITIPMTWPDGTYGLMQAAIGCPGSSVDWHHGYRLYDTEDAVPKNKFSSDIRQYLAGSFASNNLQTDFCIKTASSVDPQESHAWPTGTFCILKKNSCPAGFQSGWIYWDDDDINHNRAGGTLPDGEYNKNTKVYYCCRNDGPTSTEIFLPRDRPFILIRYKTTCQAVYGMNVHELFVHWDDEDALNKDSAGGAHPYDNGGRHNHQLYFCYYSAKQHGFVPSPVG